MRIAAPSSSDPNKWRLTTTAAAGKCPRASRCLSHASASVTRSRPLFTQSSRSTTTSTAGTRQRGATPLQHHGRPVPSSTTASMPGLRGPMGSSPLPSFLQPRGFSSSTNRKSLNVNNINPHIKAAEYAVRGELAVKSEEFRARLAKGDKTSPFDKVISANIGNPQQSDQKPLTFFRQVTSILENPGLSEHEDVSTGSSGYKSDVIARAKKLLKDVKSVGAYSPSSGAPGIKQSVADFIEHRDGYPSDPSQIYLSAGASAGVSTSLHIICSSDKTGVSVPIPQYPLYTATSSVSNARCVPYLSDEEKQWGTDIEVIKDSLKQAQKEGTDVRAIVVINPGNPTGASSSRQDIEAVSEFAAEHRLVVIADEVYQTNVFEGEFVSFKRGSRDSQKSDKNKDGKFDELELASLHSISKGMVGECGHRGGYYELVGFDPEVVAQIYKYVSIQLCAPVIGQCLVELMVNPPKEGEPSYELYKQEHTGIFKASHERAHALYKVFQDMEGVGCHSPAGSMYSFPSMTSPQKAIEAAQKEGKKPDDFYCMRLSEATGICLVPGSGFGQREGTFHFRTTFLAPGTEWTGRIRDFHAKFMDEFR